MKSKVSPPVLQPPYRFGSALYLCDRYQTRLDNNLALADFRRDREIGKDNENNDSYQRLDLST
ncbi:protein of unknown function [Vibrio tapetis subsp. tapetis]|uniref:Uncharacterized protein n=1 Tax=Vibrio tapetis subsp. tapetis TaxID=1671868 RepID=A0A2N8ZCA1_9VIBR|nr:protein of unknown function [Vibrio tapetis subsp. tapetis]